MVKQLKVGPCCWRKLLLGVFGRLCLRQVAVGLAYCSKEKPWHLTSLFAIAACLTTSACSNRKKLCSLYDRQHKPHIRTGQLDKQQQPLQPCCILITGRCSTKYTNKLSNIECTAYRRCCCLEPHVCIFASFEANNYTFHSPKPPEYCCESCLLVNLVCG